MNTRALMDIALEMARLKEETYDTGIIVPGEGIRKLIMGVDMETQELLLAQQLGVDLVVSHHPKTGLPKTQFSKVMEIQIDKMMEFGVPINKAQKALQKMITSVEIGTHVSNYNRVGSAAELMKMPYMNIHMPADLITERFVQNYLDEKFAENPKANLGDICDALNEIREYKDALVKPVIRVGSPNAFAGKIAVLMAGGTNGGSDVYKAYFEAGVGTIICMHVPEDVIKVVKEQNIGNIIVAGHMPSDSIGINKIIEAWEKSGVEVIKMSGIV
jgi:putative NIF3 family GTP cyclohydrolase 1 type 2